MHCLGAVSWSPSSISRVLIGSLIWPVYLFLKFYFIDYAITVFPIFPPYTSFAIFILPTMDPWVLRSLSLTCCTSQYICREKWEHLDHQWWPCHVYSLSQLSICAAPTSLVDCCFLNSLVVRLPFTSIFWHFWLIFVFQLLFPSSGCFRRWSISTYNSIFTITAVILCINAYRRGWKHQRLNSS